MIPRTRYLPALKEPPSPQETESVAVLDVDLDYGSKTIALRIYPEDTFEEFPEHFSLTKPTGELVLFYKTNLLAYARKPTTVTRLKETRHNA